MIITCPSCSSRFVVKTESIGVSGRKVRCAKCKHDWFQAPNEEALKAVEQAKPQEPPSGVSPIPEGGNVPAPVQKTSSGLLSMRLSFAASVVFFILVLVLLQANSVLPKMQGFYALFGIYDTKEIAFYDVTVKKVNDEQYTDLLITGKIGNDSQEEKHLPDIKISIYDKNNKKLKYITLASGGSMISPGQKIDFQNKVARIHRDSANIVIDMGNRLQLAVR